MHGLGPSFVKNSSATRLSLDSRDNTVNAKSTLGRATINLDAGKQAIVGQD